MRIVVTGIGIICSIGNNQIEVVESIKAEKGGIREIERFDHSPYNVKLGGEVQNYKSEKYFTKQELPLINRCSQFSIIAIKEAIEQSKLSVNSSNCLDFGLCFGTSHGAAEELYDLYKNLLGNRKSDVSKRTIFNSEYHGILKIIANYFKIKGVSVLPSIACASGTNAIGMASDLIKRGKAKYVICGGADAFDLPTFTGFWGLDAMSTRPTSPFSTGEYGITLGEGASFFVIESLETAKKRKADIIGEIAGYSLTNDAYHATAPHPQGEGARRCMERAIQNSGVRKEEIDYINAHGTGTKANDEAEINAVANLYENKLDTIPPISATKTFTGHTTGASGAIELALSFLCMKNDILPPTLHFKQPRNNKNLDFIPNKTRSHRINTFLSNNFGFAGCNASIVGKRYENVRLRDSQLIRKERVVITGIGATSSIGIGKEEIWQAFKEKKTAVSKIDMFDTSNRRSNYASLINDFNPKKYTRKFDTRRMDRISQLASVATYLCFNDAKIKSSSKKQNEVGIVYAVATGPMSGLSKHMEDLIEKGPDHPSQMYFPFSTQNASLGQITTNLKIGGYSTNLAEGSASLGAIAHAYDAIKIGHQRRIVAGGASELSWNYHLGLEMLGELLPDENLDACSMFSEANEGFVPGEGAAFLMVEDYESAVERNKKIYAEIVGYGTTIDSGTNLISVDPDGYELYRAMKIAVEEAGIPAEKIGIVLSSERGIPEISRAEINALKLFFGKHLENVIYTTTRFNTGWLNASTSTFNVISLLHAFCRGIVLPIPYSKLKKEPDELMICKNGADASKIDYGMVIKITRGGNNTAVILKKPD